MKKHLILGIILSLSAHVHGITRCMPVNETETTPKPHSTSEVFLSTPSHCFEIYGSALLLQPTGSNLHYAAEAFPLPLESPHWKIYEINPSYHFGFDIGVRGIFHNTNTSLSLNWEHFHSTDSSSKTISPTNMIGPFFEIGPDALPYKKAHGKVEFHFNEVNLDYGIFINFGNRLQTNVSAGIGLMRIHQDLSSRFSNLDGTIVRTIQVPSSYLGAGPELCLDFCYRIVKGFHFTGDAAVSLLVGTQKNHTKYNAIAPTLTPFGLSSNPQKTTTHSKTQIVPGIEGKLGLSYVFTFSKHYMIKLEAGYQAQVYIDAIRSVDIGSEVVTPPVTPDTVGVFARTFEQNLSNFALAGPYFTLDFGF